MLLSQRAKLPRCHVIKHATARIHQFPGMHLTLRERKEGLIGFQLEMKLLNGSIDLKCLSFYFKDIASFVVIGVCHQNRKIRTTRNLSDNVKLKKDLVSLLSNKRYLTCVIDAEMIGLQ